MKHVLKRNDFFIMNADKGAATVRLEVKYCIAKTNEQYNSRYKKLNIDSTPKHSEIVNYAIEQFIKQEMLSNLTLTKLTTDELRTPQFHILLKFHKPIIVGRAAVSSNESHVSKILELVDQFLQPYVKSLSLFVKNTTDFINRINETQYIQKDAILVRLDFK